MQAIIIIRVIVDEFGLDAAPPHVTRVLASAPASKCTVAYSLVST
jgi:hypothetical protein